MTSSQALYQFWAGFDWPAYDENTVPSEEMHPAMPRITYQSAWGSFESELSLVASLWDRSYSWEAVETKAEEIYNAIGGGVHLPDNAGFVWIDDPSAFAQRMEDEDDSIRRILIQVKVEFYKG